MATRFREKVSQPPTVDYFRQRLSEGWALAAIEWKRIADEPEEPDGPDFEDVPYGQRVAGDCGHLTDDKREMEVIAFIYDGVIGGTRPAAIAAALNQRGYATRNGLPWNAASVFELMPRIIELSPKLQKRPNWPAHRTQLTISS